VEENAVSLAQPLEAPGLRRDFLAPHSLDALVTGAARLRPAAIAFADRSNALPFGLVATQIATLARLFADCGLQPGERLLLVGGAEANIAIATLAALRGGFIPALAPIDLDPATLAAYADAIDAAAIAGPAAYGDLAPLETCLQAAAAVPSIRLVANFGPEEHDGAVSLNPGALLQYAAQNPDLGLERGKPLPAEPAPLITFDRRQARPVSHRQASLITAGLDFVARARIGRVTPILSTLPPVSSAGFVAGPCAALLSGATLHLHGPFCEEDFIAARNQAEAAHLILPAGLASDFAGIFDGLASAVLVSHLAAGASFAAPPAVEAPCPLIDLYAIDETGVIAEPRRNFIAVPPAQEPHFIGFEDSRVLTVEAAPDANGGLRFRGAAVTAE
jgi:acyl-CoA synthetase (AMP-forming)/AMP-acid ligase II